MWFPPLPLNTSRPNPQHKTTMLGTLFGINAFDQPGVELGKKLANEAYKKIS